MPFPGLNAPAMPVTELSQGWLVLVGDLVPPVFFEYALAALVLWVPLGGAVLAVLLPPRSGVRVGRWAALVCTLLVAFLALSPAVTRGASVDLYYPLGGVRCAALDALGWLVCLLTAAALLVAVWWDRPTARQEGPAPALDSWVLVCAFTAFAMATASATPEVAALLAGVGLMPALYVALGLPYGGRRRNVIRPAVAGLLSGALFLAGAQISDMGRARPAPLDGIFGLSHTAVLGLIVIIGAAYAGAAMFPFCLWPSRIALSPGRREAAFLLGSTVFLPGAIALARVMYVATGRVWRLQWSVVEGLGVVYLLLVCFTVAYLFIEVIDEWDVGRRFAVLASIHGAYLFAAAIAYTVSVGSGSQALVYGLVSRVVEFSLVFLALDWLAPELRHARGLDGLRAAAERYPFAVLGLVCGMASLAGLPPFIGFWSKWVLARALTDAFGPYGLGIWAVYAVEFVLLASWVVLPGRGKASAARYAEPWRDMPTAKRAILGGLTLLTVAAGPAVVPMLAMLHR